ncbi:c-type cytochrome [Inquilinus sp. KBS0705]|nr:c-type cytochrome [Inquilinus sp. KBS0705]
MTINKKLFAVAALLGVIGIMAMAPAQPKDDDEGFKNLKVLPKNISKEQLHDVMEEWEHALGARCSFCHVRNEDTKKMDFVSDAKPEKEMARHMFQMMNKINKKYFGAKKGPDGMLMESGVNCNSCHRGTSHPEVVKASGGPGGPPPGAKPGEGPPPSQGGTPPTPPPSGGRE